MSRKVRILLVVTLFVAALIGVGIAVHLPSDNRVQDYLNRIEKCELVEVLALACDETQTAGVASFRASLERIGSPQDLLAGRGNDLVVPVRGSVDGNEVEWSLPVVRVNGKRIPCPKLTDGPFGAMSTPVG
jgi:hypothetical protein